MNQHDLGRVIASMALLMSVIAVPAAAVTTLGTGTGAFALTAWIAMKRA